jgi:hypothetical protein
MTRTSSKADSPLDPAVIIDAPELALIGVLDEVITMMTYALLAAHPHLIGAQPRHPDDPADERAARRLFDRLSRCRDASAQYRRETLSALQAAKPRADNEDF